MEYNVTYSDKVHKYTINLPISLYNAALAKSRQAGFEELAPWLRAVVSREVLKGDFSLKDILGEKEFVRQEYLQKAKKIERPGFIQLSIKRISNIINPKQHFLDFKSPSEL